MLRKMKKCLIYLGLIVFCVSYIVATHYLVERYQDIHDIPELWHSTLNLFYPDDTSCYHRKGDYLMPIEKVPVYPDSIFFHETTCQRNLGVREACSIEAAARSHPNKVVYVLFVKPLTEGECLRGPLRVINKLVNVRFSRADISTYALNTPLQDVFNTSLTAYGKRHHRRVAEYLKFLTLHRFGGMVVDLDIMLWTPTDNLGNNWAVKEADGKLGSAVIAVSKGKLGTKMTPMLLKTLRDNSNSSGIDGGQVLFNVLEHVCNASDIDQMDGSTTCDGFKFHDIKLFYTGNHSNWVKYSVSGRPRSMALGLHFWNSESDRGADPENSTYADMADRYCPNVFKEYGFAFVD